MRRPFRPVPWSGERTRDKAREVQACHERRPEREARGGGTAALLPGLAGRKKEIRYIRGL